MLWSAFFSALYNLHFVSWAAEKLATEMSLFHAQLAGAHSLGTNQMQVQRDSLWIPGKTSHTICIVLGIFASSWIRSYVRTIQKFGSTT